MASTLQWWGYRHTNGSLHTKRYLSELDLDEAHESPFCEEVFGPFDADSGDDARRIVIARLAKPSVNTDQINPPWIKASMTVEQAATEAATRNCYLRASFDPLLGVRIVAVRRETGAST